MRWSGAVALLFVSVGFAGCLAEDTTDPDTTVASGGWFEDVVWDTSGGVSQTLTAGPHDILPPETLHATGADGTPIGIVVWRPDTNDPVPVIVEAGPYWPDDMTTPWFDTSYYVERFVPHGFAFARVAVRGTAGSGGCQEFMGPNEQRDLSDAVTQLATQPWSNGNVAMIGKSYDGSTPWMVAAQGNPHLKTIVPIAGMTDPQQSVFPNGTMNTFHFTGLFNYWRYQGIQHGSNDPGAHWLTPERWCPGPLAAMPELAHATATGDIGAIDAAYWEERDFGSRVLGNYDGSVFLVHGFDDTNVRADQPFPLINRLQDAGTPVKVLLGQWGHDYPDMISDPVATRWDFAETLLRWFQRWLYENETVDTGPTVDVQEDGGAWRTEEAWPPHDAIRTPLYLGDGVLAAEPQAPGSAPTASPLIIDGITSRSFATTLDEPLRIAGAPWLDVTVTTVPPQSGIFVVLHDVDPEGTATLLAGGGGSIEALARGPVQPGAPVPIRIQFHPTDDVVPAGHTLRLSLYANSAAPPSVVNVIHWGGEENALRLPVIERDVGDGRYPGQPVS